MASLGSPGWWSCGDYQILRENGVESASICVKLHARFVIFVLLY